MWLWAGLLHQHIFLPLHCQAEFSELQKLCPYSFDRCSVVCMEIVGFVCEKFVPKLTALNFYSGVPEVLLCILFIFCTSKAEVLLCISFIFCSSKAFLRQSSSLFFKVAVCTLCAWSPSHSWAKWWLSHSGAHSLSPHQVLSCVGNQRGKCIWWIRPVRCGTCFRIVQAASIAHKCLQFLSNCILLFLL